MGDVLACGFGMTAAVWVAAYLSRLLFVQAPGQVTVGAMVVAMVLVGGFVAARYSSKGVVVCGMGGAGVLGWWICCW